MAASTPIADLPEMTAEEFFDWVSQPERNGCLYELEQGKVIEVPPASRTHGIIAGIASLIIYMYLAQRGRGYVVSHDSGMLVSEQPATVCGPDLAVFLENDPVDNGDQYVKGVPELIVEVRSPSDRHSKILRRIDQYLKRGVKMVWIIDLEERTITSYRSKEFPKVHDESERISGHGVLPEFDRAVADFFRLPHEQGPKS
jgi:Uma2 family endonuclease